MRSNLRLSARLRRHGAQWSDRGGDRAEDGMQGSGGGNAAVRRQYHSGEVGGDEVEA